MPETIVLAGAERIGDLLFATGAFALLREARPEARIAVQAQPAAASLLEGNPAVDVAVGAGPPGGPLGRLLHARRAAAALARALGTADGVRFVALRDRPAYRAVAGRLGISYEPVDILDARFEGHMSARCAQALAPLGVPPNRNPLPARIFVPPAPAHGDGRRLVLIHATSSGTRLLGPGIRDWPADRFTAVARALAADPRLRVALIDPPRLAESLVAHRIARASGAHRFPRMPVRALASALAGAALLVSNDTGTLHLATAAGAPVLAILGPTDPALSGPVAGRGPLRILAPARPGAFTTTAEEAIAAAREMLAGS